MKITIKKTTTVEESAELWKKLKPARVVRLERYVGKVKMSEDPLRFQKEIRNEWE